MKLTFILMTTVILQVSAASYGQNVDLTVKNASLEEVFNQLRKQSGYNFFYQTDMLNEAANVSISVKNKPLLEVLDMCLNNQPLTYNINQNNIVIRRRPLPVKTEVSDATITGLVTDSKGAPLVGVTVKVKGTTITVASDADGKYSIKAPTAAVTLVFSYIGFVTQEIETKGKTSVNVTLLEDDNSLNEVVVVAYGQQKKESMVSAITTVNPKDLKGPTSNLTTMLAGKISGIVSYQRSGEPGADNASFFIRGIGSFGSGKLDPLILIDGMESTTTSFARLQPDDILAFSILKDAAASSLYGARGANGVILVTTKTGKAGTTKFNARFENSLSTNTQNFDLADNITYMKLANEAVLTRTPNGSLPYTQNKIDHTIAGDNPYLYPNNDWLNLLIRDNTLNQRLNMNLSGGGKMAQYYLSGTFNQDNGVLKRNNANKFNNNVNLKSYQVRSNVNVMLTPTTEAIVRTSGEFDNYTGPIGGLDQNGNTVSGGAFVFLSALRANPVMFTPLFPSSDLPTVKHPLFGNAQLNGNGNTYVNPYARMVSGFQENNTSTMNVQLEFKQDLKFLTEGLAARLMVYTKRYSFFDVSRSYNPFFYAARASNEVANGYNLSLINEDTATEYLSYNEGSKVVNTANYGEMAVTYNRTFQKHAFSGLLIGIQRSYLTGNGGSLTNSLVARNLGVSGRFTYGYDNRYLFETNFGYNGSERFAKKNRFGFFPSVGFAWNVNNEKFFKPLTNVVNRLKLRATYGLVGNDQIGNINDRFFYLSNVNPNAPGYQFGTNYGEVNPGYSISRYANDAITWEKARKLNIGMDLDLFNEISLVVDVYKERRSNILMQRAFIPTTLGLESAVSANVGVAENKGIDLTLDYTRSFGSKTFIRGHSTFTYATNKLLVNEEPDYGSNYWLSRVGQSLQTSYGYVAERLFVDDEEVKNSPFQSAETKGGDIKYRDLNGDGLITSLDQINGLGYPTTPEIIYGFGFTFGFHNFEFSTYFQGSARSSFFIDPSKIAPFIYDGGYQNGLLNVIADSHWSEDNRNSYAFWPRLSPVQNSNNNQPSSWWLRNGDFLRMKSAEIAYNFRSDFLKRFKINSLRLYANGTNLFVLSSFKLWDPEQGSNGLGYPVQKVFNLGLNIEL